MKFYKLIPRILRRELFNIIARTSQDVIIRIGASGGYNNVFEGKNLINSNSAIKNSKLGFATYISGDCNLHNIRIGRFCSIGQRVCNVFSLHPSQKWVSTHPAFFSINKQAGFTFVQNKKFDEQKFIDERRKFTNIVGNDVWIGNDVSLMPGVKIGDGAIIGAGAIITKSVEPYAIIGGVPAKLIRYRFEKNDIEFLLKFRWWEKDYKWLRKNAEYFRNISSFKELG